MKRKRLSFKEQEAAEIRKMPRGPDRIEREIGFEVAHDPAPTRNWRLLTIQRRLLWLNKDIQARLLAGGKYGSLFESMPADFRGIVQQQGKPPRIRLEFDPRYPWDFILENVERIFVNARKVLKIKPPKTRLHLEKLEAVLDVLEAHEQGLSLTDFARQSPEAKAIRAYAKVEEKFEAYVKEKMKRAGLPEAKAVAWAEKKFGVRRCEEDEADYLARKARQLSAATKAARPFIRDPHRLRPR